MEVLNEIGHGFHEKPYENALVIEFRSRGIDHRSGDRSDDERPEDHRASAGLHLKLQTRKAGMAYIPVQPKTGIVAVYAQRILAR